MLGRRSDGYHDLRMVMTSVALADVITLETGTGDGVRASANLGFLPTGEKNLAASALLRFQEATGRDLGGGHIFLEKHIPVCAGMEAAAPTPPPSSGPQRLHRGGPVSSGAGPGGEAVGSDVPYCVLGGTALAEGRGRSSRRWPRCPAVRW